VTVEAAEDPATNDHRAAATQAGAARERFTVLDTADVDPRRGNDPLRIVNDLVRQVAPIDRQPSPGDAVGDTRKLAVVRRAEVEAPRREQDSDRIEQFAVEDLDAHDRLAFGRQLLLHEERSVEAGHELGRGELLVASERDDPRAAAANVFGFRGGAAARRPLAGG
jgi:hypothetical protein